MFVPMIEGKDRHGVVRKKVKTFLHDKPAKKGQGTHEVALVETPEYQALIERVFKMLKAGARSNEILADLMVEDHSMTEDKFMLLLKHTYAYAENALQRDREYLFQLHMDRYEKIYQQAMTMTDSWHRPLDPHKDWQIMLMKFKAAMKALRSKEELIGLHDKSMVLEFNDHQATVVQQESLRGASTAIAGYDLEQLDEAELYELLQLIKLTRTVPIEGVQRVVVKKTKIEINTQTGERNVSQQTTVIQEVQQAAVVFEDMPAQVVHKMKDVTKPIDEPQREPEPNVADDVPKEVRELPVQTLGSIQERLRQKAMEALKGKGK